MKTPPRFQYWQLAWAAVTEWRQKRDIPTFGMQFANDPIIAPQYARDFANCQTSSILKAAR